MERAMVMRARVVVSLAGIALVSCYDLERLDPGPKTPHLLVDDFEDGDAVPRVASFENWKASPFKKGPEATTSGDVVESDLDGGFALLGEFVFSNPPNSDFTGGSLGIGNARNPPDVRQYRAIHVTARFQPGALLPSNTRFYAELQCNAAPPLGNVQGPFYVQLAMPVTSDWKALRLDLDRFNEPTPEQPLIAGGRPACLATVDAIRFTISTNLAGLTPRGGSFYIDDVSFE
jgi:hypothetical protein